MAHILIVDDQKSVLLTLESLLVRAKHSVVACTNAMDAMEKLNQEPFDLLVTDAIMPTGGSGYSLIKTIRQLPKVAGLPVILLTGKREREDVERGLEAGANDYVVKPIDPEVIIAKVNNLLATTSKEVTHFAEAPVRVKSEWDSKTDVVAVSEIGFTIESNLAVLPGTLIRIQSSLFSEIGIPNTRLRIVSCEEVRVPEPHYRVQANFVGLSEKEMTPLRLWIRGKKI